MDSKRRARKQAVRRDIFARDNYTCQVCHWKAVVPKGWDGSQPLTNGKKTLTIDHILERSLGGPSTRENFRACCDLCNVQRSVHVGKLVREGQKLGLDLIEARKWAAERLGLTVRPDIG